MVKKSKGTKKLSDEAWIAKRRREKEERASLKKQVESTNAKLEEIKNVVSELEAYYISTCENGEPDPDILYNACIRICVRRAIAAKKSVKWFIMHAKIAYLDEEKRK